MSELLPKKAHRCNIAHGIEERKKFTHRKRERYSHFLLHYVSTSKAQTNSSQQTRKENIGEPQASSTISHIYSRRLFHVNCCFCCRSRRRRWKCQKKCFQKKFFVFQFCFVFGTVQSRISCAWRDVNHISQTSEKKKIKIGKKFCHDKSSSCWIIKFERKLFAPRKNQKKNKF